MIVEKVQETSSDTGVHNRAIAAIAVLQRAVLSAPCYASLGTVLHYVYIIIQSQ